jgi:hypothetical protein
MRTYDIINAGPKNRFMANGRIVSNSGRLLQVQNLPQNHFMIDRKEGIDDLDVARKLVAAGDGVSLEMLYGNVPDTLSQLIRTAIIPEQGHRFLISDYAAIEARVLAWVAGEQWRLDLFNEGIRDIYIESVARALGIPYESIDKKTPQGYKLRTIGKLMELGSGFGGGRGAYMRFGAIEKGLEEDKIDDMITAWRVSNLMIFTFWYAMENAAKLAIQQPGTRVPVTQNYPVFDDWWHPGFPVKHFQRHNPLITFKMIGRTLYMFLPSGRMLSYVNARIGQSPRGGSGNSILFDGVDQTTKRWGIQETYGGKLTENCLSGDTLVLTDTHGWIQLVDVTLGMKLWDGENWVSHDGIIYKGEQPTLRINGVRLTGDHLILVGPEKWTKAEDIYDYESYTWLSSTGERPAYFNVDNGLNARKDRYRKVYDIKNAGPQHRFSVRAKGYTPFIVHNCVQAVARDCLAYAMMNLDAAGYQIVMSVHDEVVLEVPYGQGSIDDVNRIMGMVPDWATGLPLKAESFETNYYKKE